jgi:hypothetical protein
MATLKDIAKKVGDLTVVYAPINKNPKAKTRGNLKRKLSIANTPTKILKYKRERPDFIQDTKFGIQFSINYAPKGAEYGKFVEEGFKHKGGKTIPPNPFAEKAINDPSVRKMIKDYTKELAKEVKKQILEDFRKK